MIDETIVADAAARVAENLQETQCESEPNSFPVICAWCWYKDHKRVIVGRSDAEGSHGICRKHAKQLRNKRHRR